MHNNVRNIIEKFVFVAIILVLIHTLVQDIADLLQWTWGIRKALVYAGFAFDLFFSIEFCVRFLMSLIRKNPMHYVRNNHGWIDFIASIPLLILSSGPAAFSAFHNVPTVATAAGVFGVLKIIKAIRIARVLRLLRLLKVFKHIKYTDSIMVQRHITRISTTSVIVIVIILLGFSLLTSVLSVPNLEHTFEQHTISTLSARIAPGLPQADIDILADLRPDVLIIKEDGRTIYSRTSDAFYQRYYGPSDYTLVPFPEYNMEVYIDLLPIVSNSARDEILHFIIIVGVILAILFFYGPHFASSVSDPIQIMARGFSEKGHSLQIVISPRYKRDEIYALADKYNEVFLPLKDRSENSASSAQQGSVVDIDIDDVKKFINT